MSDNIANGNEEINYHINFNFAKNLFKKLIPHSQILGLHKQAYTPNPAFYYKPKNIEEMSDELAQVYIKLTEDYFININNEKNDSFFNNDNHFSFIPYEIFNQENFEDRKINWLEKYCFVFNAILDEPFKKNYDGVIFKKYKEIKQYDSFLKISECSPEEFIIEKSIFDNNFLIFNNEFKNQNDWIKTNVLAELVNLGYSMNVIPNLSSKIIENYECLEGILKDKKKNILKNKLLSASFIKTCRGEYQCPVKMRFHYANSKNILKENPEILSNIDFTNPKLIKNYLEKAFKSLELNNSLKEKILELHSNIDLNIYVKNSSATSSALIYLACKENDVWINPGFIAKSTQSTESTMRTYAKELFNKLYKKKLLSKKCIETDIQGKKITRKSKL